MSQLVMALKLPVSRYEIPGDVNRVLHAKKKKRRAGVVPAAEY
jgi:hypothetical protein